jgi:hypothetical protein
MKKIGGTITRCGLMLSIGVLVVCANAANSGLSELPGSVLSVDNAVSQAKLIAIARVEGGDQPLPVDSSKQALVQVDTVVITSVLKGSQAIMKGRVPIVSFPGSKEGTLEIGRSYILFMNCDPSGFVHCRKVVDDTEANVATVKQSISHLHVTDVDVGGAVADRGQSQVDPVSKAGLVVIAKVDDIGVGSNKPRSTAHFLTFTTQRVLKGEPGVETAEIALEVREGTAVPKKNDKCLLFLKVGVDGDLDALDMQWPVTDEVIQRASAQIAKEAEIARQNQVLPGSAIAMDEAARLANWIFVGTLDQFNGANASANKLYGNIGVTATAVLKGNVGATKLSGIPVDVLFLPREAIPESGRSYLFFFKAGGGNQFQFIKMLNASDDNIAAVKKLVAAPASSAPAK